MDRKEIREGMWAVARWADRQRNVDNVPQPVLKDGEYGMVIISGDAKLFVLEVDGNVVVVSGNNDVLNILDNFGDVQNEVGMWLGVPQA